MSINPEPSIGGKGGPDGTVPKPVQVPIGTQMQVCAVGVEPAGGVTP